MAIDHRSDGRRAQKLHRAIRRATQAAGPETVLTSANRCCFMSRTRRDPHAPAGWWSIACLWEGHVILTRDQSTAVTVSEERSPVCCPRRRGLTRHSWHCHVHSAEQARTPQYVKSSVRVPRWPAPLHLRHNQLAQPGSPKVLLVPVPDHRMHTHARRGSQYLDLEEAEIVGKSVHRFAWLQMAFRLYPFLKMQAAAV